MSSEKNELEKPLKAIANRRRLAIVKYLKRRNEANVSEIAKMLDLSFKSTSRHLAVLFAADILEREQRSLRMYYRLSKTMLPVIQKVVGTF